MTLRDSIIHFGSKRDSKSAVHVCGLQKIVGKTEEIFISVDQGGTTFFSKRNLKKITF